MIDGIQGSREYAPDQKALVITGFAIREIAAGALVAGAGEFIARPFRISRIRQLIEKLVGEVKKTSSIQ